MSDRPPRDLQLALCGSPITTTPVPLCLPPIKHVSLTNWNGLKSYVDQQSDSNSIIILFWNFNDQQVESDLEYLKRQKHVFAVFICVKRKNLFTFNGEKVHPVAKQFIYQKVTSGIIRFFQRAAQDFSTLNHTVFANECTKQVNYFKSQLRRGNPTVNAPHVVIIMMNVTEELSLLFYENMIDACDDICAECEPRVYTLDCYFGSGEDPGHYGDKHLAFIRRFMKKVGGIQIYLFGNEPKNLHTFSQGLFQSESNSSDQCGYDERPILMEYEPVTDRTKSDLCTIIGSGWGSANFQLKRLDDLRQEFDFQVALERVNRTVVERTKALNEELNRQATDPSDNSISISGTYQVIQQAVTGPRAHNSNFSEDVNDMIQAPPNQ